MTPSPSRTALIGPLLAQARLSEAVDAATDAVRSSPGDTPARILLADLLCLQGALDRADAHLQIAGRQSPAEAVGIAKLRGLLRAEAARAAWFRDGAPPSFIGAPTPRQQQALRLALALRAGDAAGTRGLLDDLERTHVARRGACDGTAFDDFRDADDLVQDNIETLGANGQYYWIAPEALANLKFAAPRRPRDLMWRHGMARLRNGQETELWLPAQYRHESAAEDHRLARRTDWIASIGGLVRGCGQRIVLLGSESRGFMDISEISFDRSGP
jgi:type VI secretion system protein ImpE